jgi:hypothetical protein
MPAVLKRLMRHASINTTMQFYVSADAAEIAEWPKTGRRIWRERRSSIVKPPSKS